MEQAPETKPARGRRRRAETTPSPASGRGSRIIAVKHAVEMRTGSQQMKDIIKNADMLASYIENGTIPSKP